MRTCLLPAGCDAHYHDLQLHKHTDSTAPRKGVYQSMFLSFFLFSCFFFLHSHQQARRKSCCVPPAFCSPVSCRRTEGTARRCPAVVTVLPRHSQNPISVLVVDSNHVLDVVPVRLWEWHDSCGGQRKTGAVVGHAVVFGRMIDGEKAGSEVGLLVLAARQRSCLFAGGKV